MNEELSSCPQCQGPVQVFENCFYERNVKCTNKFCKFSIPYVERTYEEAVTTWNLLQQIKEDD